MFVRVCQRDARGEGGLTGGNTSVSCWEGVARLEPGFILIFWVGWVGEKKMCWIGVWIDLIGCGGEGRIGSLFYITQKGKVSDT